MADETKAPEAGATPPTTPPTTPGPVVKSEKRKYAWKGKTPKDEKVFNLYKGHLKLRPWAMTDEDIDKLLVKHPDLARLWEKL